MSGTLSGSFQDADVRQMVLPLSERRPILVRRHVFDTPQDEPRFDTHYALEIGIVLDGAVTRFKGRETHAELGKGELWFDGLWESHGNQVLRAPCALAVIVLWPPLLADARLPEAPSISWMAPFSREGTIDQQKVRMRREEILRLGTEAVAFENRQDELSLARLRFIVFELLLIAIESLHESVQQPAAGPESYGQITAAINAVFNSSASIANADAAAMCGMGEDKFMRLFKGTMGITFSQFALRYRLSRAAKEIASADEAVKTIAENWGFTDQSHLHRLFAREYGCTPMEYRRRMRKEE